MYHTLNQLYHGEINPSVHHLPVKSRLHKFQQQTRSLYALLSQEQQEQLDRALTQMLLETSLECQSMFDTGFTLGCQLTQEVMAQS